MKPYKQTQLPEQLRAIVSPSVLSVNYFESIVTDIRCLWNETGRFFSGLSCIKAKILLTQVFLPNPFSFAAGISIKSPIRAA
jgi:hypothetical protein